MRNTTTLLLVFIVNVLFTKVYCDTDTGSCFETQFQCTKSGRCIAVNWRCDGDVDCGNGDQSDEENCDSKTCPPDEFQCHSGQCILEKWKCDGEKDCYDGTDEATSVCNGTICQDDEFRCNNGHCISSNWRCDGTKDCRDGEDETCDAPTCAEDEMRCANGKCLTKKWICDGENDCGDSSDEVNCTTTCTKDQFQCADQKCIDMDWKCDGDYDCDDHSDEVNCKTAPVKNSCIDTEWACLIEEQCILKNWKCDGDEDCFDGTDEQNCTYECKEDQFKCANGHCVDHAMRCDGLPDCTDGTDEVNCSISNQHCADNMFDCFGNGKKCMDYEVVCNGLNDCGGWEDEKREICTVNPCETNNGGCDQVCEPVGGNKHKCSCKAGYKLNGTSYCVNIDECKESSVPVCSQICSDTKGHYKCSCVKGYKLEHILGKPGKTTCKIDGPRPWLLFANKYDVRKLEVGTWFLEPVVEDLSSAVSVAYYKDKYVYWSDVHREKISRLELKNGTMSNKKVIIDKNIDTPDGIAIDWLHDLLYWTDAGYNSIHVSDLDGNKNATVVNEKLDEPRGIALDPRNGYMYVTDWGRSPKIERIGLDGSNRKQIITNVVWPNSITIDYIDGRIFWIDAKLHTLESANLDGSNVQRVIHDATHITHPFGLAVFEDDVYWTDRSSDSIRKANKRTGEDFQQVALGLHSPMDIKIYHESMQRSGENVCEKSGCVYLCLPSPVTVKDGQIDPNVPKFTCACPDHMLLAENGINCVPKAVAPTRKPVPTKAPTRKPVPTKAPTARPETTHAPQTNKPIVVSTSGPGYTAITQKPDNKSLEAVPKSRPQEQAGIVAFVAIGVVLFIVILLIGIGCFAYRRISRRNVKSMNFDNPVYRKTTTDDSILIGHGHQRDGHHIKGDPSVLKPLTEDV